MVIAAAGWYACLHAAYTNVTTGQSFTDSQPLLAQHKQRFQHHFQSAQQQLPDNTQYGAMSDAFRALRTTLRAGFKEQRHQIHKMLKYQDWLTRQAPQSTTTAAAAADSTEAAVAFGQAISKQLVGSPLAADVKPEDAVLAAVEKLLHGVNLDNVDRCATAGAACWLFATLTPRTKVLCRSSQCLYNTVAYSCHALAPN